MGNFLLLTLVLLMLVVIVALVAIYRKLSTQPQNVETAVLSEKISHLEPITQTVSEIKVSLAELQVYSRAHQELERSTAESVRRLETVIAGTHTKGTAGENILEEVFSRLPIEWQERDFRVGNKTVEFGLRLPNKLVLPIDSKWTATSELERLAISEDIQEQQKLKKRIESALLVKAREVKKYVDPNLTPGFGVAVIPDAVYEVCSGMHSEIFKLNVVVISHSMFVPYLLLVFQTTLKTSKNIDLQKLNSYLESVESNIDALQGELDGRFSRAMTMMDNARRDMSGSLSNVKSGLTSLRLGAKEEDPPELVQTHIEILDRTLED